MLASIMGAPRRFLTWEQHLDGASIREAGQLRGPDALRSKRIAIIRAAPSPAIDHFSVQG
jgi:hypothetical protein